MSTRRAILLSSLGPLARGAIAEPAIIPRPNKITLAEGAFRLSPSTPVVAGRGLGSEARLLASALKSHAHEGASRKGGVNLSLEPKLSHLGREGYRLRVSPESIEISAASAAGVFYGCESLKQLLPPAHSEGSVPCLEIEDAPRFPWRGCLVDPARHFKPVEAVLKFIDALAVHKINTLQLHLTDDQGWRIEIRKYPKLTEVGSIRKETRTGLENKKQGFDGKPHGGFYTQSDIRKIVAYAAARHITVVPEIEMPGHAQAALAAYPEFGVTGEKVEVWTQWGVSKNIFGVDDKTFRFLQDVLTEVMELFPGKYIHVGGDEVPPDQWRASEEVQRRKKELGLSTETQLHAWFIGRINTFLRERGRTLVGWDEIIEGGLAPGAVVMSWHGMKGGIEAARRGHDVVMTPHSHTYFDYYQCPPATEPLAIGGLITLDKVYGFDPVPPGLSEAEAKHILGTQGQLWSEYIRTASYMEYMAFPRMCALAEVAWTQAPRRDYADFNRRLPVHLERLKAMKVNFRPGSCAA
jgi:hexosaminidase